MELFVISNATWQTCSHRNQMPGVELSKIHQRVSQYSTTFVFRILPLPSPFRFVPADPNKVVCFPKIGGKQCLPLPHLAHKTALAEAKERFVYIMCLNRECECRERTLDGHGVCFMAFVRGKHKTRQNELYWIAT